MSKGWVAGGLFFLAVAIGCYTARLTPFAVGAAIISLVMFAEARWGSD